MTKEEALKEYGDVPLKFSSYYKYSFFFGGEKDGVKVSASIGGNLDDIYRLDVSNDMVITLSQERHSSAYITKDGVELWSEYDA